MSYSVEFTEHPDYLEAIIHGTRMRYRAARDALEAWQKITSKAAELKCKRVLAVTNLDGALSIFEAQTLGKSLEMGGWDANCKLAFINQSKRSKEAVDFASLVSRNRGMRVKVFNNEQPALEWLLN